MSVGLQLVAAVVAGQDRTAFRMLREEYFVESELPAWRFLSDHAQRHGAMPTVEAFAEQGIALAPATGNASYHLELARHRATYNAIQATHGPLMEAIRDRDMDAATEALVGMNARVGQVRASSHMRSLAEWSRVVRSDYDEARRVGDEASVTLGWEPLDALTGGLQSGDVCAVVARPNVGKSYTLLHMALQAWRSGRRVLVFTMEMTDNQIAHRLVGINAGIDPKYIRQGRLSAHVFPTFERSLADFESDRAGEFHLVGGGLRNSVRDVDALVQEVEPDVVYVDASYLLKPENVSARSARWERLVDVGEALKAMALTRHTRVVHSVQFNRSAKAGSKRDYDLDMIGGTDTVGQLSTLVIGIRHGAPPHEKTRRRYTLMKNREGGLGYFDINYLFAPIDFSHVPSREGQGEEAMAQQNQAMTDLAGSMV